VIVTVTAPSATAKWNTKAGFVPLPIVLYWQTAVSFSESRSRSVEMQCSTSCSASWQRS
jgi:hypothetical protein